MSKEQEAELDKVRIAALLIKQKDTSQDFHHLSVEQALAKFETDPIKGLTSEQVERLRYKYGYNELTPDPDKSLCERIWEQFEDTLVRILLVAASISFFFAITGDGEDGITAYVEPFVILLILFLNGIVAIWMDSDADSALEALMDLQAPVATVVRNGAEKEIEARDLVPGDLVKLLSGDCVPADVRLTRIESVALQVSQASLTGESVNVSKTTRAMDSSASMLQDQKNVCFSSTDVKQGQAFGVVAYTGVNTAIGSVHEEVQKAKEEEEDTPLKKQIDDFGDKLAWVIGIICLIVWIMNFNKFFDPIHGTPVKGCIYYFKIAIALAVAAIPEGLPAVITTCLALGTRKMAKNNCIVRRLSSVETLGCTNVICSDKTGTLTKNEMCAVHFATYGQSVTEPIGFNVQEDSYSPEVSVVGLNSAYYAENENFRHIAANLALNCFATLSKTDGKYKVQGSTTEGALKVLAAKMAKLDNKYSACRNDPLKFFDQIEGEVNRVATLEFSSERKTMSTVVTDYDGNPGNTVFLKGAGDRVINKCTGISLGGKEVVSMTADLARSILKDINEKEKEGLRVLGLAYSPVGGAMQHLTVENRDKLLVDANYYDDLESDLIFLGYVCIKDPCRPEVKASIKDCKTAGISVIMITGDSKATAIAIAKELGIIMPRQDEKKCCFTGQEFEMLSPEQKVITLKGQHGKVFSRVEPRHKRELVKLLIDMGRIVAMTGDGVNDAPALKQANIGVAMGITGTEVAKRASDMVLNDDNFATIVKAIEEGRSIYSNMKAFIRYLISSNIGEVLSIFFFALLGIPEAFNSVQLLWVNLTTDGPPATALGFNPPDKDVMEKPPRRTDDGLISNWIYFRYAVVGFYVGLATVGIFVYWYCFANTGDGHTLVTFAQLTNWTECPKWKDFQVNNFIEGMDLQSKPCDYFMKGKVKASTLSLSVLVTIEMLNAFNAISEDHSLLTMTPLVNPYLFAACAVSIGFHFVILYVPFLAKIFSIHPMSAYEWWLVFAFSFPVILIDEVLKVFARMRNAAELNRRLAKDKDA